MAALVHPASINPLPRSTSNTAVSPCEFLLAIATAKRYGSGRFRLVVVMS